MRVAVEDLTFAYRRRGGERIVDNLTYTFPGSAVTVVTGPSGCGKSTLLYLLALMLRASSGRVIYDGREVSRLPDGERSRLRAATVGFVFQDAMLDLSRSVASNVGEGALYAGMSPDRQEPAVAELLQRFNVDHRADHRPGEVSGGQAQRIALCRALVKRPALVLGDEPTGNLDARSTEIVWDALAETASRGATVVVATHDLALAARADQRLELGP
jgi:lipoprotein-releasing system ATP-binding protein